MRAFSVLLLCGLLNLTGFADSGVPIGDYNIGTVAGSSWVGDNGPAVKAILIQAEGVCAGPNGNIYIADSGDNRVRKVTPDGVIHTLAGTGTRGSSGDGGPAASALLNSPYGLACDGQGNVFIADLGNGLVREVSPKGIITTIAGGGGAAGSLSAPRNLALDGLGNLYVSDFNGQRIYELPVGGMLTVIAGTGIAGAAGDGGTALQAQFRYPAGLALDGQDSLYIADSGNHLIRKLTQGMISSVARAATPTGVAFGGALYVADPSAGQVLKVAPDGSSAAILTGAAQDLAFAPDGSLYVSESTSVLKLAPGAAAASFAGGGNSAYGDSGPAIEARLNHPSGVAIDSGGNLYIADRDNHRIRQVTPDGTISSAVAAGLTSPASVSVDAKGNLYIADTGAQSVIEAAPDGTLTTILSKDLLAPVYAIPDGSGNVYISDADAGRILRVGAGGLPQVVISGLNAPRGLALDQTGNLYFTETGASRVSRLAADGTLTPIAAGAWKLPGGVAVDSAGDVLVADAGLQQVVAVDPAGHAAAIAGTGAGGFSGDQGAALDAQLAMPFDVALLSGGAMVVADLDNNRVRLLIPVARAAPPAPILPLLPDAVNAASLTPGPVAAGMLLLIQNTGLAPADIANTQILFGETAARILSADASGILAVAPQEIAGLANVSIGIVKNGNTIGSIPVAVADSAVALFTGSPGQAAANNQDGSINSAGNPAARGSIISLYGTGLGLSGAMAGVAIGGFPAQVLYSGPVPQYPGLFQVNALIPSGYFPPGDMSVVVTEGSSASQQGVSIWVN